MHCCSTEGKDITKDDIVQVWLIDCRSVMVKGLICEVMLCVLFKIMNRRCGCDIEFEYGHFEGFQFRRKLQSLLWSKGESFGTGIPGSRISGSSEGKEADHGPKPTCLGSALSNIVKIVSGAVREGDKVFPYGTEKFSTGVFVNHKGLLLSSYHGLAKVEDGEKEMNLIYLKGEWIGVADLVEFNEENNLALLQVAGFKESGFLLLGDSDHLKAAHEVCMVSYPETDIYPECTFGYVSRAASKKNSENVKVHPKAAFDDDIGSPGAPVLNIYGLMVGINVEQRCWVYGQPGGATFVPIQVVRDCFHALKDNLHY